MATAATLLRFRCAACGAKVAAERAALWWLVSARRPFRTTENGQLAVAYLCPVCADQEARDAREPA